MYGVPHAVSAALFCESAGVGFLLGLLSVLFALPRRLGLRRRGWVIAADLLFAAAAAAVSYAYMFYRNAGVPRGYLFFGEALGFFVFYLYKPKKR